MEISLSYLLAKTEWKNLFPNSSYLIFAKKPVFGPNPPFWWRHHRTDDVISKQNISACSFYDGLQTWKVSLHYPYLVKCYGGGGAQCASPRIYYLQNSPVEIGLRYNTYVRQWCSGMHLRFSPVWSGFDSRRGISESIRRYTIQLIVYVLSNSTNLTVYHARSNMSNWISTMVINYKVVKV